MSPAEMLDALDAALARAKAKRLRRREVAIELTAPVVLGQHAVAVLDRDGREVYGFTAKQCRRMRAAIVAAIRADMTMMGVHR